MNVSQTQWQQWRIDSSTIRILSQSAAVDASTDDLHPNELQQSLNIRADSRRLEYIRSRWLLHQMIPGQYDFSRSENGIVAWPQPWKGSITHSRGNVGLAASCETSILSVGIDIEAVARVRTELSAKICSLREWDALKAKVGDTDLDKTLAKVFAAKEALYKALYPLGRIQFWFEDAEVVANSYQSNLLELRLLKDVAPQAPMNSVFHLELKELELDDQAFVLAHCGVKKT